MGTRQRPVLISGVSPSAPQEPAAIGDQNLRLLTLCQVQDLPPDAPLSNNPSYTFVYSAGQLSYIEMQLGSTTYRKTFSWNPDGTIASVSAWTKQ